MFVKSLSKKRERDEYHGFIHESDLVLGSICDSLVADRAVERMISAVNVHSVRPRKDGKEKATRGPRTMSKVIANTRHSVITAEHIARTFNIGLNKAKETLRVTTKKGVRTAQYPLTRRYRVDHLNLHRNYLRGKWYVDWMPSATK